MLTCSVINEYFAHVKMIVSGSIMQGCVSIFVALGNFLVDLGI